MSGCPLHYITGKSIRMPCYFQDFQAESSPILSEADIEEGLTWQVRGLYLLCNNHYVQYFCCVREEQLKLYLKMHMYGKQSTLSHEGTISTCCHHSVVKIFLNF